RFGSYVEDMDFCFQVTDAGHKIGIATHAVAWELGSVSPSAGVMVKANTVRLRAKRGGWRSGVLATASLALMGIRSGLGGFAPWCTRDRRFASRRQSWECFRALAAVVRPGFWV